MMYIHVGRRLGVAVVFVLLCSATSSLSRADDMRTAAELFDDVQQKMTKGDYPNAVVTLKLIIEKFPKIPAIAYAKYQLGICYDKLGEPELAKVALKDALRNDPGNVLTEDERRDANRLLKRYVLPPLTADQKALLSKAEADLGDAERRIQLQLPAKDQLERAIAGFTEILRIAPNYAPAEQQLATACEFSGKGVDAYLHYKAFLEISTRLGLWVEQEALIRGRMSALEEVFRKHQQTVLVSKCRLALRAGRFNDAVTFATEAESNGLDKNEVAKLKGDISRIKLQGMELLSSTFPESRFATFSTQPETLLVCANGKMLSCNLDFDERHEAVVSDDVAKVKAVRAIGNPPEIIVLTEDAVCRLDVQSSKIVSKRIRATYRCGAISSDGKTVAVGATVGYPGAVVLFDALEAKESRRWWLPRTRSFAFEKIADTAVDICFAKNDERVISVGDSHAAVWETKSGAHLLDLEFEKGDLLFAVGCSSDGSAIVGGSASGKLLIWDASTGAAAFIATEFYWIDRVSVSADGRWAIVSGVRREQPRDRSVVELWDLQSRKLNLRRVLESNTWLDGFSEDGRRFFVLTRDGRVECRLLPDRGS